MDDHFLDLLPEQLRDLYWVHHDDNTYHSFGLGETIGPPFQCQQLLGLIDRGTCEEYWSDGSSALLFKAPSEDCDQEVSCTRSDEWW
jgi:hypothetical protein